MPIPPTRDHPIADRRFAKLTNRWHLWHDWSDDALVRALDGNLWVAVVPDRGRDWAILVGSRRHPGAFHGKWIYEDRSAAMMAATEWPGPVYQREPCGWVWHPRTGRTRARLTDIFEDPSE